MIIYSQKLYCVYLTIYTGNKLPPFYIGSSTVYKVLNEDYHGSISSKKYREIYKSEITNNPHLFKTRIIATFYSRKMAAFKEKTLQKKLKVVKSPMYFNESVASPNGSHGRDVKGKNHPRYGISIPMDERPKYGQKKGRIPWNKGKTGIYTEKTRHKMGSGSRRKDPWNKGKKVKYSDDHVAKWTRGINWIVINPNGLTINIKGLKAFCRDQGLSYPQMRRVAGGVLADYRGWRCIRP